MAHPSRHSRRPGASGYGVNLPRCGRAVTSCRQARGAAGLVLRRRVITGNRHSTGSRTNDARCMESVAAMPH
jgi:hypothetical protein